MSDAKEPSRTSRRSGTKAKWKKKKGDPTRHKQPQRYVIKKKD